MSANDLDLPFEEVPGTPPNVSLAGAAICGGVVVRAAVLPFAGGSLPALVFDFHLVDGQVLAPVVLVSDDDQLRKLVRLIEDSTRTAIARARDAS